MRMTSLDHLVLCVADVAASCRFYERMLGLDVREERPGKWSLHVGAQKISLQDVAAAPAMARDTVPGSGNFCLLTDIPVADVAAHLKGEGVEVITGPCERIGAAGPIMSIYFRDPDGNLVEVGNPI